MTDEPTQAAVERAAREIERLWMEQQPEVWLYEVGGARYCHLYRYDYLYTTDGGETFVKGVPLYRRLPKSEGGMSPKVSLPPLHCGFDAISAEQAECLRQWATSAVLADRRGRAGLIEQQAAEIERLRGALGQVKDSLSGEYHDDMGDSVVHAYSVAVDALAEQRAGEAP
jgi:hypothetical protein